MKLRLLSVTQKRRCSELHCPRPSMAIQSATTSSHMEAAGNSATTQTMHASHAGFLKGSYRTTMSKEVPVRTNNQHSALAWLYCKITNYQQQKEMQMKNNEIVESNCPECENKALILRENDIYCNQCRKVILHEIPQTPTGEREVIKTLENYIKNV